MKKTLFGKYIHIREETGGGNGGGQQGSASPGGVTSRVKLQKRPDGSPEFAPFTVSRTMHPNLRLLIKAFTDSDKVGVGYTTIEKNKGEVEPQLKKKTLYLTGGAVRDHLKGKTPRNYDLVTEATPSEMRMIMTQGEAGFVEVKPQEGDYASDERYAKLPAAGSKSKAFYVSRWDKQGKEMEITAVINGEKFNIATLSKSTKSRRVSPDQGESASSVEEDASNRDFTINSMYIPLTQADGDNSELIDPHGGAHHLKNGEVIAVGNMAQRLKDDPATGQRYVNMVSRFGNPDKIPEKYQQALSRHKDMADVPKDHVRKEFLGGLEHPDTDPRKYMKAYKSTGLIGAVFPGVDFDDDEMPEDFQGDRWLAPAWILRNNEPEKVKEVLLGGGWKKTEAEDIAYLVKMYNWGSKNKFDPNMFYDMKSQHTGLPKAKVREWMQMAKSHGPEVDSFLNHDDKDLTPMVHGEDGKRGVNPEFTKHLGRAPRSNDEFDGVRKQLSTKRWQDSLNKLKKPGGHEEEQPQKQPQQAPQPQQQRPQPQQRPQHAGV